MKKLLLLILLLYCSVISAQSLKSDTLNIPIGTTHGYSLMYNCHDCRQSVSGGISVFCKKGKIKRHVFFQEISDFYVDEVSLLKINGEDFIYIGSTHTYGHSQGYLYYLNPVTMKAYPVKSKKDSFKRPDSIHVHKYFDLTKDSKNHFRFGASIRTDSGREGSLGGYYTIKKVKTNEYILIASKASIGLNDEQE
jgi:hypothetical protein